MSKSFDINENLKKLPASPGVYIHKDGLGQVIYVGKAISLRNRVRQYFQGYGKSTPKLRALTSQIAEFEYITCDSEMEALILECNLIKKYQPKYNVLLRDDKTYPYIMVTTSEDYPRVVKTRELKSDGNKYFGPFSDVRAVNAVVDMLNSTYALKRCTRQEFPKGHRPCLNYHLSQCPGVCIGNVPKEHYREGIDSIIDFLSGRDETLIKDLKKMMDEAANSMNYEDAAKYRDLIASAKELGASQRVSLVSGKDLDVVLPVKDENNSFVVLFKVRDGKLVERESFEFSTGEGDSPSELTKEFIKQYYSKWADVPHDILLEELPDEASLLEEFLGRDRHKVKLNVPKRGENLGLLRMAQKDRDELVKTLETRKKSDEEKRKSLKAELDKVLEESGYNTPETEEYRIEAYDVSNTGGSESVGAMVVFNGLRKVRKAYRRFKIKTVYGPDDYASLEEMLTRRFLRAKEGDPAFLNLPDIIFMDGGIGQVHAAEKALEKTGYNIPVVGLAKDDSHRTRAIVFMDGHELNLKQNPILFKYAGTIQEEVHRFAIEYHRGLRGKKAISSVLDEIKGIGSVRRNALLAYFGSVDAIKKASFDELTRVPGMDKSSAESVIEFFGKSKSET